MLIRVFDLPPAGSDLRVLECQNTADILLDAHFRIRVWELQTLKREFTTHLRGFACRMSSLSL